MRLSYAPDPGSWIELPPEQDDGWARAACTRIAAAQGVTDPERIAWLTMLAENAAARERGDEDARWMCVTDLHKGAMILDLDWIDLGADAPDEIDVTDAATGRTEEFVAGLAYGKRIIWVTPADTDAGPLIGPDSGALQGQVLYVARIMGTGLLVTLRSNQHCLDLIVDSIDACEQMLATISGTPTPP